MNETETEQRILGLADSGRRVGGLPPRRLYDECERACHRGELSFDRVTPLFRHAAIHLGQVTRIGAERFLVCPECGAELGAVTDEGTA